MTTQQEPEVHGIPEDAREQFDVQFVNAPFVDHVGLHWDELSPGRVRAHVDAAERHQQPYGIVHGGVYATIVETLASVGAAINVYGQEKVVVGVSNTTDFIRAHREGRLDAVGQPLHVGRTQQLWEVVITRTDGKQVARGKVRLQNIDADQALAGQPGRRDPS